jgi:hypothetical protein
MLLNNIGAVLAALLTLFILSYLIGDNPLYRLAASLFVGLTAGYAVVVAWTSVIWPQMFVPLSNTAQGFVFFRALLAFFLAIILVFKLFATTTRPASCVTALMVGVGVAVAIGGSIVGTLIPQTSAAFIPLLPANDAPDLPSLLEYVVGAIFMVVGTVATLGFFYYGGRARPGQPAERPVWVKALAPVGEVFLGTTFGVMYAGAIVASLAVFVQSWLNVLNGLQALWNFRSLIGLP